MGNTGNGAVGLHHLAFSVDSKAEVDRFYNDILLKLDVLLLGNSMMKRYGFCVKVAFLMLRPMPKLGGCLKPLHTQRENAPY
jgi:hypothetical protein